MKEPQADLCAGRHCDVSRKHHDVIAQVSYHPTQAH